MILPILYRDEHLVVIHKPAGLLVHRSLIDRHETIHAVQILRNQISQYVYPVHRLDRPTSGLMVFALSSDSARKLSQDFSSGRVDKSYLALVRGFLKDQVIDHPLKEILDPKSDRQARVDKGAQTAVTSAVNVMNFELPFAVDKFPSARYCLVEAQPKTGRKHQIRRHLRHVGHPIVGDVTHGVGRHNRFFEENFGVRRMFLACIRLKFSHPMSGESLDFSGELETTFQIVLDQLANYRIKNLPE